MELNFKKRAIVLKQFLHAAKSHNLNLLWDYATCNLFTVDSDEKHLAAAMEWLCQAQDVCKDGGVSSFYSFEKGWDLPYPETTGYIIGTFIAYFMLSGDKNYLERAIRMADWEIFIQDPSGGVLSRLGKPTLRIFNTGQVLLGWCAIYEKTRESRFIDAAIRAGTYIIDKQEDNGTWLKDSHSGAKTYYSRVDWALARLSQITGDMKYLNSALKHIEWVIRQQHYNGWFDNCGFGSDLPITHVIAYTIRGIMETSVLLSDLRPHSKLDYFDEIKMAIDSICFIIDKYRVRGITGMLPCHLDERWESSDENSCLTGNAQLAGILQRFNQITGEKKYSEYSDSILSALKQTQVLNKKDNRISGALAGSYPIYVGYDAFIYPNWATKFFADLLIMKLMPCIEYQKLS